LDAADSIKVEDAQREVQRKLGRCMLRLQQYERLLKAMVAGMALEGSMAGLEETRAKQVKAMSKQCLGALVGKFTGHLNSEPRLEENDGASQKTVDAPWASVHFSIAMSPEQEADVRSGLAELVDMRNRLVHHFIEHFDISDVKDCRAATVYLDSCYQKIDAHLDALKAWALAQDALREETALLFQSPAFIDRFMANIQPDAWVTSTAHAAAKSSAGLVPPDMR
jgi:hypothetical protein